MEKCRQSEWVKRRKENMKNKIGSANKQREENLEKYWEYLKHRKGKTQE